jgi:hypothetical protein
MFSDSFAGIAPGSVPGSVPGFVLAQLIGAAPRVTIDHALEPRRHPAGHPNVIEASGDTSAIEGEHR